MIDELIFKCEDVDPDYDYPEKFKEVVDKIADYFEKKLLEYPDCPWLLYHVYSISSNGVAYFDEDVQKLRDKYGNIFRKKASELQ